ncbi:MAG: nucleotidyltransferase family protein, partial [Tissierellia bacterium]|nr:nucleotidyltransferase family protein [Tissierellia bacterium]
PITLERIGNAYNEENLNNKISSATAIRKAVFSNSIDSIQNYLPSPSYNHLVNYINNYNNFNTLDNYTQIIHYLLRIDGKNTLKKIGDVETGLENRIINKSYKYKSIEDLVEKVSTKRYAKTRIQRILVHLMAGLDKKTFKKLMPQYPAYIRVLASNDKGLFLLKKIKEESNIPIITKFSHYEKYNNPYLDKIISFDKKSTDLYFMGIDSFNMNMDYYTSPYIKN